MNRSVYMHSINNTLFKSKKALRQLDTVLRSKYLLSASKQGLDRKISFSGLDYISFCDYEKRDITNNDIPFYNSFDSYIIRGISIAFDKETIDSKYDVIIPELVTAITERDDLFYLMELLGNGEKRYSDLPDEVQIKDAVRLTDMAFVTYPCREYFYNHLIVRHENLGKRLLNEAREVRKVLLDNGFNTKIYDINSEEELNEEGIEKIVSLIKKH